ncbi:MAG: endonuclease III [Gammaproteobacteria bacterium GWE2_42_36]|nr:MAG: endonuclease III [Gammaproteobacteria bacterium GWE2_42_36]HCU05749.1 endonuclease III [Coxiellaceae bacterium]
MNAKKIHEIFTRFKKNNPEPKVELNYQTPFELLVAIILSAQATDKGVNRATEKLFATANTPEKIQALGETGLKKYIQTIGLYNTKAKNILKLCTILIEQYDSKIPRARETLETLPGVGRKSANVFLNTIFHEPVIAVDTHVFRVANRTKIAEGKNVKLVEEKLMQVVPDEFKQFAAHWLVLHGRYICKAKKPNCPGCFICDLCEFEQKTPLNSD